MLATPFSLIRSLTQDHPAHRTGRHPKATTRREEVRVVYAAFATSRLATQAEAADQCAVPSDVDVRQVTEQTATLTNHKKQATT